MMIRFVAARAALLAFGVATLSSCVVVQHFGKELTPVAEIDVFFDRTTPLKERSEFMGEAFITTGFPMNLDVQRRLIEAAKQRGANAVVIIYEINTRPDGEGGCVCIPTLRGKLFRYLP